MTEIAFRVVKEWDVVTIRIPDSAKRRVEQLQANNCCLGCEEKLANGEQAKCGLHPTCYQAALRAIDAKKISRSELIREGKMLPPSKGGRKPTNKFTRELAGG